MSRGFFRLLATMGADMITPGNYARLDVAFQELADASDYNYAIGVTLAALYDVLFDEQAQLLTRKLTTRTAERRRATDAAGKTPVATDGSREAK